MKKERISLENLEYFIENIEKLSNKGKVFFRGQNNSNWKLSPTMFRQTEYKESMIYNDQFLLEKFFENELEEYKKMMNNTNISMYEFYAFVQHAKQKSFMIDFTENIYVAISFALNVTNFHKNTAMSIFAYEMDGENVILDKTEADIFVKNIRVFSTQNAFQKTLGEQGVGTIYDAIQARIINIKTNDRMLYQNAVFLVYSDYLVETDMGKNAYNMTLHELMSSSEDNCVQYIISHECIPKILEIIEIHNARYSKKYLLNPYKKIVEL